LNHRTTHQVSRQSIHLASGVVEHRPAQLADVLEERRTRDATIVGTHHPRAGVRGELLAVAIP